MTYKLILPKDGYFQAPRNQDEIAWELPNFYHNENTPVSSEIATAEAENKVQGGLLLDIVIGEGAAIL